MVHFSYASVFEFLGGGEIAIFTTVITVVKEIY